jgi:hypothetical protein
MELGDVLGVHFSVVQKTLVRLRAKGWVAWERGKNRSLRVLPVPKVYASELEARQQ